MLQVQARMGNLASLPQKDVIDRAASELRRTEPASRTGDAPSEGDSFHVSTSYDFTKSTNHNYSAGEDRTFYGRYANVRSTINYKFHVNYVEARQKWQDLALDKVVIRTQPITRPWVVFTAGPMGAGKGHVIEWLRYPPLTARLGPTLTSSSMHPLKRAWPHSVETSRFRGPPF